MRLTRAPACPACGTPKTRGLPNYDEQCGVAMPSGARSASGDGASGNEGNKGNKGNGGDVDGDAPELAPRELAARLARGDALDVIDVREPYEFELARIPGARLVPLGTFVLAVPSLDPEREVVVYCHHGVRSAAAAGYLRARGFRRVWNLAGGIDRWSDEVDPTVPKY